MKDFLIGFIFISVVLILIGGFAYLGCNGYAIECTVITLIVTAIPMSILIGPDIRKYFNSIRRR